MKLLDDWKIVLRHAWAVKLSVVSVVLDGVAAAIPYVAPEKSNVWFAVFSAAVTVAAIVARLVAQPKMDEKRDAAAAA